MTKEITIQYFNTSDYFENKYSKETVEILASKIPKVLKKEHSPELLHNYKEAIDLIKKNENKNICILWDFDADWITSTSILAIWLRFILPNSTISYRVPERDDWHWLNQENIDFAISNNANLIITCDNWSNDLDLIFKAKEKWIDVIVTDHHTIDNDNHLLDFPLVNTIVKDSYPCSYLCWAWIVYKLIMWLAKEYNVILPEMETEKIQMLTLIGTVADKVKLHDENLLFALNFRKHFDKPKSIVMKTLVDQLEYDKNDGKWFWWKICPLFNVAWRLWKSNELIKTIVEWENYDNINEFIQYFMYLNEKRKTLQQEWISYIKEHKLLNETKYLNLIRHEDLPSWINRLIANEFADWKISMSCKIKDWIAHCSVMNHLNINVLKFLQNKPYTINAWWHFKAFWYSYKLEDEKQFIDELTKHVEENKEKIYDFVEENIIIDINDFSIKTIKELKEIIWSSWLEEPVFQDEFIVKNQMLLKGKHLKITFDKDWKEFDWIKWNETDMDKYELGEEQKIIFSLWINTWMWKTKKQIFFN